MFDKLGDLLSEALEKGELPKTRGLESGDESQNESVENTFSGNLHTFEEEGFHEILTLNDEDAVQLLKFVDAYSSSKISVKLAGKIKYTYTLSDKDKPALIETLRLQTVMSDIRSLEAQSKQASLQVDKYQRRLQK